MLVEMMMTMIMWRHPLHHQRQLPLLNHLLQKHRPQRLLRIKGGFLIYLVNARWKFMQRHTFLSFHLGLLVLGNMVRALDSDENQTKFKEKTPLKPLFVSLANSTHQEDIVPLQPSFTGMQMPNNVPSWLLESSLAQAPALIKGVC